MDCPFMLSKMDEDISDDLKPNHFTYSAEFVVKWTKGTFHAFYVLCFLQKQAPKCFMAT